ncbi:MAG: DUF2341 domain-containing protein [Candidatus Bathyarchaeota archaeon]|jgi:hypothetical protein|nr:DUF2341 domain-containing protein [Candidatus Bathyarchaeota archaeon A05DMB-3]MDH7606449.1 DUF2341 domain-containing protein [Candidatus Bathyarchaeota archaeon]
MLEAIIRHLKRFKNAKHGISNVLVVMLSLILVVVIAANVVLWSYQMNQLDWEKMQEKIEIVEASSTLHTWHYPNFNYRVQHNISGSTAGDLTDYQIKITIVNGTGNSEGNIHYTTNVSQPDFDDVRFTWYNSTSRLEQPIPYWREAVYDGVNATFWIKVPHIPANPSLTTIYVYYGEMDAATESNGDATFIFFDDFDDDSIDTTKWTNINDAAENGGTLRGNGGNQKFWMETLQTFSAPFAVKFKMKGESSGDFDSGIRVGNLYFISDQGTGNPIIRTGWGYPSGSAGDVVSWHIYEATILPNYQAFYDFTANSYTTASYTYSTGPLYLIGDSDSTGRDTFYDYIFVCKRVDPEPTHEAWGNEEIYSETFYNKNKITLKLRNTSALTAHIVSIWVNNSTFHKRYSVDIFINAGETVTYFVVDKDLPTTNSIVKAVTERGNIAVLPCE